MGKKTLRGRLTDWNRSPVLRGIDRLRVKQYVHQLKDEDWNVRKEAAWALGGIGFDKIPIESKVLALLILKKQMKLSLSGSLLFLL
ncbi:MAG: HEAT repeat domain-containing protein [Candidatus Bilamarchaeaceae archaeon]